MILRTPSSMKVLEVLEQGPATFSELIRRTGLPARDVAGALDQLGRKGLVVKEGYWFEKVERWV